MLLSPRRTKFRKRHKPVLKAVRGNTKGLAFGRYALQAREGGRLTARSIEAARRVLSRSFLRQARLWIRCFPDHVITAKPLEVRMGKGKGSPDHWVAVVRPGQILFEISGVSYEQVVKVAPLVQAKLPLGLRVTRSSLLGSQ